MNIKIRAAIFLVLTTSTLTTYAGCRDIYKEYSTRIIEKFGVSVGNGNRVDIILDCESDCYKLKIRGDAYGNASSCGTRKTKSDWSYSGCNNSSGIKYDVDVTEIANVIVSSCR